MKLFPRSESYRRLACLALAVAALSPFARAHDAKRTPFVETVDRNFKAWDADADGALSTPEIDALVRDPRVKGDDAAAVSALKLISRSTKLKLPPLTRDYFARYNATVIGKPRADDNADPLDATTTSEGGMRDVAPADAPTAAPSTKPAEAPSPVRWDRFYLAGKKRIAAAGEKPWAGSSVALDSMKQGALGDCFFVASLGSLAVRRPDAPQKLVTREADGSYKATFPDGRSFAFPALTDSQIAIGGTSGDGAPLAVFEQAFGKYRAQLRGKPLETDGTDLLYTGGDSAVTLRQLTGHQTRRIVFGKNLDARREAADTVLPEVRKLLAHNIQHHLAITCGGVIGVKRTKGSGGTQVQTEAGPMPLVPPAILQNHVYVVITYDAKTDQVTIWNPHANRFKPKGEPGLQNGYVTEHGQFTLPLTEAYQFMGSFTFETDAPLEGPVDPKES